MTAADFLEAVRRNPVNTALLERLPALQLPQCHLVAGCLFQAVWNARSGREADWGVKDYDVFYFDDTDLSWEAEDAVIQRAAKALADLGVQVEIRNQARVHLWYPQRFGYAYPQLHSARAGIDRYFVECTCVGVEVASGELYAPHGLQALAQGLLRVNSLTPQPQLFAAKAHSYAARWPWLRIEGGADAAPADTPAPQAIR